MLFSFILVIVRTCLQFLITPLPILQPSSRMILIDKASEIFYWIEVGTDGIHQRRKSSGFFRNMQEPLKLREMVLHA